MEDIQELFRRKDALDVFEGTDEANVEKLYTNEIFRMRKGIDDVLQTSNRQLMNRKTVPFVKKDPVTEEPVAKYKTPAPDLMFGYNTLHGFPDSQHQTLLGKKNVGFAATTNKNPLVFPFLVVEFKGTNGDIMVAVNQCLGGSASCVNIVEKLNRQLREETEGETVSVDSTAFSIAMNGELARIHVSWKHDDLDFYMSPTASYLLSDADHFLLFRKVVRNILDWGKNERLEAIRKSLGALLEAPVHGKTAAETQA
ncbi:MAG: hypothetical protein STHCBS139747_006561 [Sporothrix thermara]